MYSFESAMTLLFPREKLFLQTLREFYEAFVLYCFTNFMFSYLGSDNNVSILLSNTRPLTSVAHAAPFCFLSPWNVSLVANNIYT